MDVNNNNNIILIEGRHVAIKNTDGTLVASNNCLTVWDSQENSVIEVPVSAAVLEFFGIPYEPLTETQIEPEAEDTADICTAKKPSVTGAVNWKDDAAVKNLIMLRQKFENMFKSTTVRKDVVWDKIAFELEKINSNWKYTSTQCENKWKYHRKEYVKVKDHNRQSGNSPKTCAFYEEIDEVLGDKPCVSPVALASSCGRKRHLPGDEGSSEEQEEEAESAGMSENRVLQGNKEKKTERKKKTRVQKELEEWTNVLRSDAQEREAARKKRHEEGLSAYRELMGRLIDKL